MTLPLLIAVLPYAACLALTVLAFVRYQEGE